MLALKRGLRFLFGTSGKVFSTWKPLIAASWRGVDCVTGYLSFTSLPAARNRPHTSVWPLSTAASKGVKPSLSFFPLLLPLTATGPLCLHDPQLKPQCGHSGLMPAKVWSHPQPSLPHHCRQPRAVCTLRWNHWQLTETTLLFCNKILEKYLCDAMN